MFVYMARPDAIYSDFFISPSEEKSSDPVLQREFGKSRYHIHTAAAHFTIASIRSTEQPPLCSAKLVREPPSAPRGRSPTRRAPRS